jgi:hypothetical protein
MFLKFEHHNLAISEVSHYNFLRGHFLINQLKDPIFGFQENKLKE